MITLGQLTGIGRTLIRDGCTGKESFDSYGAAERRMGTLFKHQLHRPEQGQVAPYLCQHCSKWHVGHFKIKEKKQ